MYCLHRRRGCWLLLANSPASVPVMALPHQEVSVHRQRNWVIVSDESGRELGNLHLVIGMYRPVVQSAVHPCTFDTDLGFRPVPGFVEIVDRPPI